MNKTPEIKYPTKKIGIGHYEYRGFRIYCVGRYWEAEDVDGTGFAHSFTLKEAKKMIDYELDKNEDRTKENA